MAELFDSDDGNDSDFAEPENPKIRDGDHSDDDNEGTHKKRAHAGTAESDEDISAPKKKSRESGRSSLVEDEADEGEDDDDQDPDDEDEDDDAGDEEKDTYVADGFVVLDDGESSDDGNTRVKKKRNFQRLKVGKQLAAAEDDDLELIRDNLASLRGRDEIAPELVRDEDIENGEEGAAGEGQRGDEDDRHTEVASRRGAYSSRYGDEYDSDDMSDFVVDDDDANAEGLGEDEDPEERRRRRRERNERMGPVRVGGPLREQLEEAAAMFGEGYEELMEGGSDDDEDEDDVFGDVAAAREAKKMQVLRSKFERSTLVESFCTDHDDHIRTEDRPERMIDVMVGRHPPGDQERGEEALWIAEQLATRIIAEERTTGQRGEERALAEELYVPVMAVLEMLQDETDCREVPFIWTYRKDYLHDVMTLADLWFIYTMDEKWEGLVDKRTRMMLDLDFIHEASGSSGGRLHSQEQLSREDRERIVAEKQAELDECRMELDAAQEAHVAVSNIEDDEDDEDAADFGLQLKEKDTELIERAERRVQEARDQMEVANRELETEKQLLAELIRSQRSSRASCPPEVARKFLDLFPVNRYKTVMMNIRNELEMRDVGYFFSLLYRGCTEECGGDSTKGSKDAASGGSAVRKKIRRGLDKEMYYSARKHSEFREIVEMFSVSAASLGDAVRYGSTLKVQPPNPPIDVDSLPSSYLSVDCPSIQKVMDGVRLMIAAEIAAEPSVRRAVRQAYRAVAHISTAPTALGMEQITPFSELFGLHMLEKKPMRDFFEAKGTDKYLYARLVQAQSQGLIDVSIAIPTISTPNGTKADLAPFFRDTDLVKLYLPDEEDSWNEQRMLVLATAMEKYLLPHLKEECHRELLRLSGEAVVEESAANFREMLSVGPFRPSNVQRADILRELPQRPVYPSVATIWLPNQGREPMFMAFCDKDGVLRAHDVLPGEARNQKKSKLKEFLKMTRPDVVAINTSAGQISYSTKLMIENYIKKEVRDSLFEDLNNRRRARDDANDYNRYQDDEDGVVFDPDVILVKDDVARIFGASTRAKKLLPELEPGAASAVCLSRFVQDPLNEYAAMWTSANEIGVFGYEAWYLDLHPYKGLIAKTRAPLLRALESCLVDAVCEVGVDLNMAVAHDHLAPPLAFVAGLGLRKAAALRSNIKSTVGYVAARKELFERKLMRFCVYNNAAGFLRVCDTGADDRMHDPYDDTRIHPECYVQNDFAPKIVASALEAPHTSERYYKNVAVLKEHVKRELEKALRSSSKFKDAWMRGELIELDDKMFLLVLEEYAEELEKANKGKRLKQFEAIKQELRFPWYDRRKPLSEPGTKELFTLITGETDQSLHVGMKVGCKVVETRRGGATVIIDNGMRGNVNISKISDARIEDINTVLRAGDTATGVIIEIQKDRFRVEVSLRPSDTDKTEDYWMANRNIDENMRAWWQSTGRKDFDRYFNERRALAEFHDGFLRRSQATDQSVRRALEKSASAEGSAGETLTRRHVRQVFHPLFKNFNSREAEQYLAGMGPGEMVVRPSSKSQDSLVVTWAFQDNWYKHIEVEEKHTSGTRKDHGLADTLFIKGEDEPYADIDEIFARYIEPMNDLVGQMVCYKAFRLGSKEDVDAWLQQEITLTPNRIPYCVRFYKHPGYFVLSWVLKKGSTIKNEVITVCPEGFKLRDKFFRTPSELIRWFKENASAKPAAPPPPREHRVPPPPPRESRPPPPPPTGSRRTKPSRFSEAHPKNQALAAGPVGQYY